MKGDLAEAAEEEEETARRRMAEEEGFKRARWSAVGRADKEMVSPPTTTSTGCLVALPSRPPPPPPVLGFTVRTGLEPLSWYGVHAARTSFTSRVDSQIGKVDPFLRQSAATTSFKPTRKAPVLYFTSVSEFTVRTTPMPRGS